MTFTLFLDEPRWHKHTQEVLDDVRGVIRGSDFGPSRLGDVVPVAKGNGYGLQIERLAREAGRLGVDRLCVGTVFEAARAAAEFDGDILVLQPWDPRDTVAAPHWAALEASAIGRRVIRTVSDSAVVPLLLDPHREQQVRVVFEGVTSMRRFGMLEPDLVAVIGSDAMRAALSGRRVVLEGLALHLPLATPDVQHVAASGDGPRKHSGKVGEAQGWVLTWGAAMEDLRRAQVPIHENAQALWVSHLSRSELAEVRAMDTETPVFARIGTALWLGDADALSACGTVLAVHEVSKRIPVGYRQRKASSDGLLLVVGGGTSHGVALQAPSPATSLRQRAIAAGTGALEAAGRSRSPFYWGGKNLWFAEPPHMQVSMLWLPDAALRAGLAEGLRSPAVGDQIACRVRHTTANFDVIRPMGG